MSEGEFDRNAVIVGMVSRLSPPEWRAVVRYFAPHLAATDRQLLADILFAEANRRCAQFGRSPLDHFAGVLDELGLRLVPAEGT